MDFELIQIDDLIEMHERKLAKCTDDDDRRLYRKALREPFDYTLESINEKKKLARSICNDIVGVATSIDDQLPFVRCPLILDRMLALISEGKSQITRAHSKLSNTCSLHKTGTLHKFFSKKK